jgi:GT2 family glycosyltransferase
MASISMSVPDAARPGPTVAVIVNFRTAERTVAAVRSLQESEPPVSSIIVVDNGSGDGSAGYIRAAADGVHVIEQAENGGFAAGCNAGIRAALEGGAGRVFLLNSDAVVLPTAMPAMERLIGSDDRLGIVGPIVVSTSPAGQIESAGIRYSRRTGRMWNHDFGKPLDAVTKLTRRDVDAVSGCAMLIRGETFERVGLLDEDYFFGFEDIDFCLRARTDGFLAAVAGTALVKHEGQSSIGRQSGRRIYFATRNHLRLAGRSSPLQSSSARWLQTTSILALNLARAVTTPQVALLDGLGGFFTGARDYFTGSHGRREAAPIIDDGVQ